MAAMTRSRSQVMLVNLKGRLEDGEQRRKRELRELRGLCRAIIKIQESDERLPAVPTLVKADTKVVACKVQTADEALQLLKDGNQRFLSQGLKALTHGRHPMELHFGQRPHAVLVTCSDSRVPPELVFGQGLGDLFVIRIAGTAVDTLARASLMYALVHLGVPLVVVMGHESCGAVTAALASDDDLKDEPADIKSLVENIRGGLTAMVQDVSSPEEAVIAGVVCSVNNTVKALRADPDLANLIANKGVKIVGAYYAFNGACTFFSEGKDRSGEQTTPPTTTVTPPTTECCSNHKNSTQGESPSAPANTSSLPLSAPAASEAPTPSSSPQQPKARPQQQEAVKSSPVDKMMMDAVPPPTLQALQPTMVVTARMEEPQLATATTTITEPSMVLTKQEGRDLKREALKMAASSFLTTAANKGASSLLSSSHTTPAVPTTTSTTRKRRGTAGNGAIASKATTTNNNDPSTAVQYPSSIRRSEPSPDSSTAVTTKKQHGGDGGSTNTEMVINPSARVLARAVAILYLVTFLAVVWGAISSL